jgi:hypothetical protein
MQNWRRHSIFWPLLLIAAGVLLFVNNLGNLPGTTWEIILKMWPVILIAAGLDGYWRGEGYTGSTVVTGLGVLFLLGNLGYLTLGTWDLILRLWPLIIMAVGLDLLIGKKRPWSAIAGIVVGLAITAGIFWLVVTSSFTTSYNAEDVSLNRSGANAARGTISLPVGLLEVQAGAEGDTLLNGSLRVNNNEYVEKSVSVTGGTANFNLEGRGYAGFIPFSSRGGQEEWLVRLNAQSAYDLDIKVAVGESRLDLTGLKFTYLSVETAVGKMVLTLPESGSFSGKIQAAIGLTEIWLPKGAPVRIRFERALTSTTQPSDFTISGSMVSSPAFTEGSGMDLTVSAAIGAINVRYLP